MGFCMQSAMRRSRGPSTRRAEIQRLYQNYTSGQTSMVATDFLSFLHREQMQLTANDETAESLIDKYEIEETGG